MQSNCVVFFRAFYTIIILIMKNAYMLLAILKKLFIIGVMIVIIALSCCSFFVVKKVLAMPFYDLEPSSLTLRASFYTSYANSSQERKHNIILASKKLNNTFVDSFGEFSFNHTVGERTEKKGFKVAKIIVDGEFVDGVGGGVCQVSTTLYNAVLLAGLEILEFHPHSLPVSYVAPSFDAMVNSGWADLKFRNNTKNPVIIKTFADENRVLIEIWGQKMKEKYIRESIVTKTLPAIEEVLLDVDGNYPDIYQGEYKCVKFGKSGYTSEGYIIKVDGGKKTRKKLRTDKYSPTRSIIIYGTAKKLQEELEIKNTN